MDLTPQLPSVSPENPSGERNIIDIEDQLRKLERRDWWLWSMAVIVMPMLTFAVFSMSFPDLIKVMTRFFNLVWREPCAV